MTRPDFRTMLYVLNDRSVAEIFHALAEEYDAKIATLKGEFETALREERNARNIAVMELRAAQASTNDMASRALSRPIPGGRQ